MILGDLLDSPAVTADGERLGHVIDARFRLEGPPERPAARLRLVGLVVSPRSRTSFLGYERSGVTSPWPIAWWLRRRHRGAFLVPWEDVQVATVAGVTLRPGHRRLPLGPAT